MRRPWRSIAISTPKILGHLLQRAIELQLEIRIVAEPVVEDAGELGLLALRPVGMAGDVRDRAEVELRQHASLLGPILELRRNQPLRDQGSGGAEPVEHIERRRMERGGA